jgi:hypothetical protein
MKGLAVDEEVQAWAPDGALLFDACKKWAASKNDSVTGRSAR